MAGVEELRSLDRSYWQRWAVGLGIGIGGLVAVTVVLGPPNAWLVAMLGSFGLFTLGVAAVEGTLGNRLQAGGYLVVTLGWALLSSAAALDVLADWLWYGFGLAVLGSIVTSLDGHADRLRRALGT